MTAKQNPAFGQTIKQADLDALFFEGPGEMIVRNTLMQMAAIPGNPNNPISGPNINPFQKLFGPYTPPQPGKDVPQQQRWADYNREDWSIRQLPAINIYEAESEDKTSSNAWLNGTINFMAIWAPNQRRSDWARVGNAFKGAMQNFFESVQVRNMLDELYYITRPEKVPGLNEYGKTMVWSPNIEGIVEGEYVPVTLVSVKYRLDLRSWYRWLAFTERTKAVPFEHPLAPLTQIDGFYEGVVDNSGQPQVSVPDNIPVSSP